QYEPANNDNARAGAVMAFGQPVNTIYDFSKADRILSLDSDFLSAHPGTLKYARDFAARRRLTRSPDLIFQVEPGALEREDVVRARALSHMSRLYVIETTPTTTGAAADHHWSVKPSEIEVIARALAEKLVGTPSPAVGALQGKPTSNAGDQTVTVKTELVASIDFRSPEARNL